MAPLAIAIPGGESVGLASMSAMIFASDLVGADQDSGGREGRHCPSPSDSCPTVQQ